MELPDTLESIELHVFADDHDGDPHSNEALIKQRVEQVRITPNAFAILNGDNINNAIANSKSDIYSEIRNPDEACEHIAKLYEPIADKILLIQSGNHCSRTWRATGMDPAKRVAMELGLKDKYSPLPTLLFIRFGSMAQRKAEGRKMCYAGYITHGSGGGKKAGAKANRLEDLAGIVDADFYVHSHTHLPLTFKKDYLRVHHNTRVVTQVTKLFVNTAAALDYGGYGSVNAFTPSSKDNPVIHLCGTHRKLNATI